MDGLLLSLTVFELPEEGAVVPAEGENEDEEGKGEEKEETKALVEAKDGEAKDGEAKDGEAKDGEVKTAEAEEKKEGEGKAATIPRFRPRKKKAQEAEEGEEEGEGKEKDAGPAAPCLRVIGYDPKSGHKSLLLVPSVAVQEVVTLASQAVGQAGLLGLLVSGEGGGEGRGA